MTIISPSVLAADFSKLGQEVKKAECAGATYIHLDVMDGRFVPNISFGMPVIASLRKVSSLVFDVHLMIEDPIRYVKDFVASGADLITFHYESCNDPKAVIDAIKAEGVKAAIAIKPATPAEVLFPYLGDLDMVLVMTVEPGFGGQKMIPETLGKVHALRQKAMELNLDLDIQVDGGITADNLYLVTEAGANVIVAGSAIFRADDPKQVVDAMKEQAALHPFRA